ncbi:MBL fold metallo-hydrolase [Aquimarina sp. RZ0]|uniref:MBL fold metallo-hydrolase n=1 Tax=Aquimarina sp. RZ0 TaxID=2607730 RepID=UPI0011F29DF9|nr:MBL fold metallo-hydrolase [Aquimarina sp. RZ0]KAA1245843.1 MBL fold metallo-hydrolase [Aquimarina sp. RZ0]
MNRNDWHYNSEIIGTNRTELTNIYNFSLPNIKRVYHLKKITIGHFNIVPILTPGHTLGSICYLIEDNLFSGDTVFIEGVGICDLKNVDELYDSIQFLKSYIPRTTLFWPGHSFGEAPGKSLDHLLKNNIYFQFKNKEHFIKFRTRHNQQNYFTFK